jgi:hypothetical protein
VRVRRPRALAGLLFVHDEQQAQLADTLGTQSLGGRDLRRDDPFGVARPAPVEELIVL